MILILIIGGRYGYVDARSSKSVTNIEYLAARQKGIPIYAFVDRRVLPLLPVWEKDPSGDFSNQVDNIRVFDFIKEVRTIHSVWTVEFGTAQDIISALRNQFAHLMKEGIRLSKLLRSSPDADQLAKLHGRSLRLALEQPPLWEYDFLCELLKAEIGASQNLKLEYDLELALGIGESVSLELFGDWGRARMNELQNLASAISALINKFSPEALGPPGVPGDLRKIAFLAHKVAEVYRHSLEWASRVRRSAVDDRLVKTRDEMARMADDMIGKIEFFGPHLQEQINGIREAIHAGTDQYLEISMELELSNADAYFDAFDKATNEILG